MAGGKANDKAKKKVIEDKSSWSDPIGGRRRYACAAFGLKNKNKSAKVAKYVQQVEKTASNVNDKRAKALERERERQKAERAAAEAHSALIADVSKVVITQPKASKGGDSKSIVCEYFKRGLCTKGTKCKFSHDLAQDRKTEKRSIYAEADDGPREGTMENWTEGELREAIDKKHGSSNRTKIVCKYFIQAVEERKYGWLWQCPNGPDCMYRHALPPGFVLRSLQSKQEAEQPEDVLPLEAQIEEERAKLTGPGTPVTLETFTAWKERKRLERAEVTETAQEEKRRNFLSGRKVGLTGRDLFEFDPTAFQDDDDAGAAEDYNAGAGAADDSDSEELPQQQSSDDESDDGGAGPSGDVQVDGDLFAAEAAGLDDGDDDDDDDE